MHLAELLLLLSLAIIHYPVSIDINSSSNQSNSLMTPNRNVAPLRDQARGYASAVFIDKVDTNTKNKVKDLFLFYSRRISGQHVTLILLLTPLTHHFRVFT